MRAALCEPWTDALAIVGGVGGGSGAAGADGKRKLMLASCRPRHRNLFAQMRHHEHRWIDHLIDNRPSNVARDWHASVNGSDYGQHTFARCPMALSPTAPRSFPLGSRHRLSSLERGLCGVLWQRWAWLGYWRSRGGFVHSMPAGNYDDVGRHRIIHTTTG